LTGALAAPSPLRDGEVTLLPLDATVPALLVAASVWNSWPRRAECSNCSLEERS